MENFIFCTVVNGFIDINSFSILCSGLNDLRKNLAIIPQDPVLFIGTIRYNLDPFSNHSDDKLWSVLEQAHIKEMVSYTDAAYHKCSIK